MYDARFLPNPYFVRELRDHSGLEEKVSDYVFSHEAAQSFLKKILDMNEFLFPHYLAEGKNYLRIGIACSGGRHRSVALAERIGQEILANPSDQIIATLIHRDVDR